VRSLSHQFGLISRALVLFHAHTEAALARKGGHFLGRVGVDVDPQRLVEVAVLHILVVGTLAERLAQHHRLARDRQQPLERAVEVVDVRKHVDAHHVVRRAVEVLDAHRLQPLGRQAEARQRLAPQVHQATRGVNAVVFDLEARVPQRMEEVTAAAAGVEETLPGRT